MLHHSPTRSRLRAIGHGMSRSEQLLETIQHLLVCKERDGLPFRKMARLLVHAIDRSQIDWVHMRHEEAGAFAAAAEALLTGRLTACAGTCGPGSLHFINGLYEANRNRAPVILIATQIVRQDLGFESIQEIDYLGDREGEQTLAGDGLEISERASRAEHVIDRLGRSVDLGRAERRRGLDGQQQRACSRNRNVTQC